MGEVTSLLAINVTRIGDTLLTTPSLRAIAAANPEAELSFLGHPKRTEIIKHLHYVTHVGGITKKSAPFFGRLGGKHYEQAFVFGFDEALVAYALRVAKRVIAFRQKSDSLNRQLYRCVDAPDPLSMHAVDYLLTLPAATGIAPVGKHLDYVVTADEALWAQKQLMQCVPPDGQILIGLQVASFPTRAYRDWPVEHFIQLTTNIRQQFPRVHFLIFGGSEEKERTSALARHLGTNATLYAGRLSLRETSALMQQLDLYIGVDTGPTHIMGALHRPIVALYHGYTPSWRLRPLDHPCAYIIDHPLDNGQATPETPMSDISVERVWHTVQQAIAEHPPSRLL